MNQNVKYDGTGPAAATAREVDLVVPPLGGAGACPTGADLGAQVAEVDRRSGLDRRRKTREDANYVGPERRQAAGRRDSTGLERRRGAGIRRSEERKAAEEGEMYADQFEFVMAVEAYKKVNKKLYPTWTEILEVIRQLGYRKVQARAVKLENVPEAPLERAA